VTIAYDACIKNPFALIIGDGAAHDGTVAIPRFVTCSSYFILLG